MHRTIIDPMDIYTTSKSCKLEVNSPKNIRCLIQWINKTIIQTFKRSEKVVNWLNLLVLISSLSVYSALASCSAEAYFSAQVFFLLGLLFWLFRPIIFMAPLLLPNTTYNRYH